MAKKVTTKSLRALTEELLDLQAAVERYKEVEALLKDGLQELGYTEMVTDRGRVFISISERVTVSPALARDVLGPLAEKVIVKKESVPNDVLKGFVKAGLISEPDRERLLFEAEKTQVVSLHVRPLK
ncbi:MAG: hypothetical protein L6R45_29815 [Anaerolineae bacterium]|nr:hypothetical protein [Anaerolineae bacterium]